MRNVFNPEIVNDPNVAPVAVIAAGIIASLIIASLIIVIICLFRARWKAIFERDKAREHSDCAWSKYEWTKTCADAFFQEENWGKVCIMDSQTDGVSEYRTWIGEDRIVDEVTKKEEEE